MEVWNLDEGPEWGWADDIARLRSTGFAILLGMVLGLGGIGAVAGYLLGARTAACAAAPALIPTETGIDQ